MTKQVGRPKGSNNKLTSASITNSETHESYVFLNKQWAAELRAYHEENLYLANMENQQLKEENAKLMQENLQLHHDQKQFKALKAAIASFTEDKK